MPEQNDNKVTLAVVRKSGKTVLEFHVPKVVRDIWADKGLEVAESSNWPGLQFYKLRNNDRTPQYRDMLERFGLFDDFGAELVDDSGKFNVAFLRSVDADGKIPVNGELAYGSIAAKVRDLAAFVREFVEGFVADYRITGSVSIEL